MISSSSSMVSRGSISCCQVPVSSPVRMTNDVEAVCVAINCYERHSFLIHHYDNFWATVK